MAALGVNFSIPSLWESRYLEAQEFLNEKGHLNVRTVRHGSMDNFARLIVRSHARFVELCRRRIEDYITGFIPSVDLIAMESSRVKSTRSLKLLALIGMEPKLQVMTRAIVSPLLRRWAAGANIL
jgi:hypothetical protein